jgi:hypothetical protein
MRYDGEKTGIGLDKLNISLAETTPSEALQPSPAAYAPLPLSGAAERQRKREWQSRLNIEKLKVLNLRRWV